MGSYSAAVCLLLLVGIYNAESRDLYMSNCGPLNGSQIQGFSYGVNVLDLDPALAECRVASESDTIYWMRRNGSLFDPPYAYIATCGASDTRCTSSYPDLFNVTRSGLVSNLTVVSVNRSNYVTGGQFACRTEHESQKSDYATCTIEAGWPSEVESCCATMDPHTKEVKGGCFIRKAWNPANYECNWYEKQGTYPWTQVDHKRLWPNTPEQFFEGGLQYTNFTCLFTRRVPNSVAHYNYRVNILPGDLNLDVPLSPSCWFQTTVAPSTSPATKTTVPPSASPATKFTTHGGWVQKPSNQVAQVGNTATFVCISSNLSPSIVWTQGTKVLFSNGARMSDAVPARYRLDGDFTLLITDVRASDAGEYGCNIQDYGSASANLVVLGDSDGGGAVFTTKPPLVVCLVLLVYYSVHFLTH